MHGTINTILGAMLTSEEEAMAQEGNTTALQNVLFPKQLLPKTIQRKQNQKKHRTFYFIFMLLFNMLAVFCKKKTLILWQGTRF